MSGGIGLPAPKKLLEGFSVEDIDDAVKSGESAKPCSAQYAPRRRQYATCDMSNIRRGIDMILALPEGTKFTSAHAHGASFWTQTARLDAVLPDGKEEAYFLKVWPTLHLPCRQRAHEH